MSAASDNGRRSRRLVPILTSLLLHLVPLFFIISIPASLKGCMSDHTDDSGVVQVHLVPRTPPRIPEDVRGRKQLPDGPVFPVEAEPPEQEEGVFSASPPDSPVRRREAPEALAPPGAARKRPARLTGPQDCLLKVVARVCPDADLRCMEEYAAFCQALPVNEGR